MEQNEQNQAGRPFFSGGQSPDGISRSGLEPAHAPASLLPALLRQVGEYQAAATALLTPQELAAALNSPQWHRRAAALQGLGRSGTVEILPLLAGALRDEHPIVRVAAVRALGLSGQRAPLDLLLSALKDPAWQVREAAVLTLGQLRVQGYFFPVAPLVQALDDDDRMVRAAAALALHQIQPDGGIEEAVREEARGWEQGREYENERKRPAFPEGHRVSRRRLLAGLSIGTAAAIVLGGAASYAVVSGVFNPARNHPGASSTATPAGTSRITPVTDPYSQWVREHGIMFGFDAQHTGFNPVEKTITPGNVSSLTQAWFSHAMQGNVLSSPVVSGGLVYSGSLEGKLYAIEATTGQTRWTTPAAFTSSTSNVSTPAVFNDSVYICLQDRRLYAFDARQGTLRWNSSAGHDLVPSPIVAGGVVYATGGGRIYAFDASSGHSHWVSQPVAGMDSASSPVAVANGLVYVCLSGSGAGMGRIYAFDTSTGTFKWSTEPVDGGVDINSSPTVVGDLLYIGTGTGALAAFGARSGKRRWTTPAAITSTGSSPAIANGFVYFANDRVTAFDAQTGQRRWATKPIGAYNDDTPLVANGVVYVCSAGINSVYALDAANGQILWTSPPANSQLFTTPGLADGVLYASSEDGSLYAFSLPH